MFILSTLFVHCGSPIARIPDDRLYSEVANRRILGAPRFTQFKMMRPKVLLAMTTRWIPMVRLAMSLNDAGFLLDAVCLLAIHS